MLSAVRDTSRKKQGSSHETMSDHERDGRALLLGEGQELRRQVADHVAIEPHIICAPEALKNGKQQQWIFRRLSQRLGPFDQQTGLLHRLLRFHRGISLDVHECVYERDLKLDLLAA